jgi:hypothetical protein
MSSSQAEKVVEEQAQVFEDHKNYLVRIWEERDREQSERVKHEHTG